MGTEFSSYDAEYKECYVVFLDLLGFKVLVENSETDLDGRKRLTDSLDRLRETLCNNPAINMRFGYFSDCIIITAERSELGLWELLASVCILACNLLQNDVLIRGAMTAGGALHNEQFVYGTAVSRAAVMEKAEAVAPLTLLSPEVYEDAKGFGPAFLGWLEEDAPGRFFVHYLRSYAEYHDTPALPGKVVLDEDADRVVSFVSLRLQQDEGGVLQKAQWLQSYWNRTAAKPGRFPPIQDGIVPACPTGGGSIIVRRLIAPNR